jgi:simple sugar transport system permease protein
MSDITTVLVDILKYTIVAATPLLFASIGGLFSELSGMLNIALEGLMGIGAFFGMAAAGLSHNVFIGVLAAIASAVAASLLMGVVILRFKANLFIAGLAINLLAGGITTVLSQWWYHTKAVVAFSLPDPLNAFPAALAQIPFIGPVLLSHSVLTVSAWLWTLGAALIINNTRHGIRIRATGMHAQAVLALGYSPDRARMAALVWSGIGSGLGGFALGLSISAFVPNIVSGRGWIALVAIYLGRKKPLWIAASCLLFAFAESLSNYIQGFSSIPPLIVLALPYAVTLVSLIVAGNKK